MLAMRGKPEHMQALAEHGIAPIDMVVVNLYRFEEVAAKADATLEELIENIDIGGPTMIRSAAKNYQDVAVVVSPADYAAILEELRDQARGSPGDPVASGEEGLPHDRRLRCAPSAPAWRRSARTTAARGVRISARRKLMDLRYGENPHQSAALYGRRGAGIAGAEQLHGKELSYNNLVDLDAALATGLRISSIRPRPSSSTPIRAAARSEATLARSLPEGAGDATRFRRMAA